MKDVISYPMLTRCFVTASTTHFRFAFKTAVVAICKYVYIILCKYCSNTEQPLGVTSTISYGPWRQAGQFYQNIWNFPFLSVLVMQVLDNSVVYIILLLDVLIKSTALKKLSDTHVEIKLSFHKLALMVLLTKQKT